MRLFFSEACPYAHRSLALLHLLEQPFERRPIDLANKPADFVALSPTGAVPLLEDDGLVLYESAVINEYLAERFAWQGAFSADQRQRARERLAMKRFDDVVIPAAVASIKAPSTLSEKPLWRREVEQLARTVERSAPEGLLGLHVATHWVRVKRAFPENELVRTLAREAGAFLDAAGALPCVVATSPPLELVAAQLRARLA